MSLTLKTGLLQLAFSESSQSQLYRRQLILNSSARAVFKSPKILPHHFSSKVSPVPQNSTAYRILKSYTTYKTLQSGQPSYLHRLLNVQHNRTTRSSDVITLQCKYKYQRNSITFSFGIFFNTNIKICIPETVRSPLENTQLSSIRV